MNRFKKSMAFVLMLLVTVLLVACNAAPAETAPTFLPEKVEKKDFSTLKGIVDDYTTWYEEFMKLPIASADMTEEELRQSPCVPADPSRTFQSSLPQSRPRQAHKP